MKKLILIVLVICGLATNIFADLPNPPSTEINDGQPLIARPVYNSLFSLYDILNGKINSLNIRAGGINADRLAGGITPFYLQNPFDINSILSAGNITFDKLNSDIFGGAASVIYNNGYIDLRYNTTLFEKDGSNNLNIKNNSITGTQINTNLAGAGLSFDTSTPQALKVNVDTTYLKIDTTTNQITFTERNFISSTYLDTPIILIYQNTLETNSPSYQLIIDSSYYFDTNIYPNIRGVIISGLINFFVQKDAGGVAAQSSRAYLLTSDDSNIFTFPTQTLVTDAVSRPSIINYLKLGSFDGSWSANSENTFIQDSNTFNQPTKNNIFYWRLNINMATPTTSRYYFVVNLKIIGYY